MVEIKVLVRNLRAYNEGRYVQKELTLPMDADELAEEIRELCPNDEDWAIHDWETELPIEITEATNVFKLNEFAQELDELEYDEDVIAAVLYQFYNREEAMEILREEKFSYWYLDTTSHYSDEWENFAETLGYDYNLYFDGSRFKQIPDGWVDDLDYEKMARNLKACGYFTIYNNVAIEIHW